MQATAIEHAIGKVLPTLPFPGYDEADRVNSWRLVGRLAASHIPPNGRILDFGCGLGEMAAFLSRLGYKVSAGDDLRDDWHVKPQAREKILQLAAAHSVDFRLLDGAGPLPWQDRFDMVVLHHVLEHIGDSPRPLIETLVSTLKDGGCLLIAVPSAVNIRKRLDVLRGRTNHPPFDTFYWSSSPWRGHHREYCRDDLVQLAHHAGLNIRALGTYHYMTHRVPRRLRPLYRAVTAVVPGWRDSWYLVAQRPHGWKPPGGPSAGSDPA